MQKKRILSITIFTMAFMLLAKGSFAQSTSEEMALQRIEDRINSMEKNMSTMQQELYKGNKGSKNKSSAPSEPIGTDDERARKFNGKIEELEHSIDTLANKLDKIIADIDFRIAALEKKVKETPAAPAPEQKPDLSENSHSNTTEDAMNTPESVDGIEAVETPVIEEKKKPSPAATPSQAKSTKTGYDKALELMKSGKYDEAEKAFKDYLGSNPKSELADKATYWLGDTYYQRKDYQQAAVNFLKSYREYPKGNLAPDSLFKLALSLKGMKKEKESCATLDKLKKEYPSADKAILAKVKSEKSTLKCK